MKWSDRYIGLPHAEFGRTLEGCDCWGLVGIVYREELDISLPDYLGDYGSTTEQAEIAALITEGAAKSAWVPVSGPALAFDVAVFRRGRFTSHVGIVVRHGLMLHMADRNTSHIETYQSGPWNSRLSGVYRHSEVIARGARP